jgi:N-methylhydantoinase A/oxoprolinase/acetone carboxylase beta subunit
MVLEPVRIIPLSIAADKWPIVIEKLKSLNNTTKKHTHLLHEFFCLVKDISGNSNYTQKEISFCEALKDGPLIYSDAAAAIGTDIYNFKMHRLEKEGIIIRCDLTPTDIMHIKGDFNRYNSEAAKLGAEFVAACVNVSQEDLYDLIYDKVKKTLYINIVRMLLEDKYPNLRKNGLGDGIELIISESWEKSKSNIKQDFLKFEFNTPATLVGIGAPIHIFLPDVAKALGTKCVIPENASVANALGALIGNITATCEIEVKPQYNTVEIGHYIVYGKSKNSHSNDKEQAIAIALDEAKLEAKDEVIRRGAFGDVAILTEVIEDIAESKEKIQVLLGIKVIAKAVGRIAI